MLEKRSCENIEQRITKEVIDLMKERRLLETATTKLRRKDTEKCVEKWMWESKGEVFRREVWREVVNGRYHLAYEAFSFFNEQERKHQAVKNESVQAIFDPEAEIWKHYIEKLYTTKWGEFCWNLRSWRWNTRRLCYNNYKEQLRILGMERPLEFTIYQLN